VSSYERDTERPSFAVVHNVLCSLANSNFLKRGPVCDVLVMMSAV